MVSGHLAQVWLRISTPPACTPLSTAVSLDSHRDIAMRFRLAVPYREYRRAKTEDQRKVGVYG